MKRILLLRAWCYIQWLSVSMCHSANNAAPCELYINAIGTNICYWLIDTRQDALSSEDICERNEGTLAYIPNEESFLNISTFVAKQLYGDWNFIYIGYRKTTRGDIVIQGTNIVQSWITWDLEYAQPESDDQECISLFTYTFRFHDAECSVEMYALCSSPYRAENTTFVSTELTSPTTTDVTTDITTATTIPSCCNCEGFVANPVVNITKELQEKLDNLKKETKVNEENLSSTIRKRTCASDPRPSSAYVGYLGIGLLTVAFGGVFLLDLTRLFMVLKTFPKICMV